MKNLHSQLDSSSRNRFRAEGYRFPDLKAVCMSGGRLSSLLLADVSNREISDRKSLPPPVRTPVSCYVQMQIVAGLLIAKQRHAIGGTATGRYCALVKMTTR